jgi:ribulose-phosphate 3-epimerase
MGPNVVFQKPKIAPSLLSADFGRLAEEVRALEKAGADWIHLDVMDGHFVPNLTMGPQVVAAVRKVTRLPLDAHLMVAHPDSCLEPFVAAGADFLTVHAETCPHLHRTVHAIRELGVRPGVVLNPSTPLTALDHILEEVDLVLLMTVNPGFGGQTFISSMLPKIASLRRTLDSRGLTVELEVDGGLHVDNIRQAAVAGATVYVSGSGILGSSDYAGTIRQMREQIAQGRALGGWDEADRPSTLG